MKIKDLKDFIDRECTIDVAIVVAVNEGKSSKGSKYLSITLQDSTGTIEAKKWEVNPGDEELFALKSVVSVTGFPLIYNQSQLQIKLTDAEPVSSYDENDLIIQAPIDLDYLYKEFKRYQAMIEDHTIKTIVDEIVSKNEKYLLTHPAAKTNHHDYAGGLIHHEVSMLHLAEAIINLYPNVNKDLLYGGIILHDLGKVDELSGPIATEYTLKGRLIGHISILHAEILNVAKENNLDEETVTLLEHMVLSHHGKLEFGSPVLPCTLEAEIMSQIDNMDSKIVMINKALKDVEVGGFSNRIPGLDGRAFYKHK